MKKFYSLSNVMLLLAAAVILLGCFAYEAESLHFNHTDFPQKVQNKFTRKGSAEFHKNAIQVTQDSEGQEGDILKRKNSGRTLYNKPLKLWSTKKNVTASFNTTFQLNISPKIGSRTEADPRWGDGIAFILSGEKDFIPENSFEKWLGIVNETTNGNQSNNIVAVEFDTNKSYPEDVDENHVGLDVNSIYSIEQQPLTPHGVNLSSADNVTATLRYNGTSKELLIFVFMTNHTPVDERNWTPIISKKLDLSAHLPHQVYVGFSASTGVSAELNCVTSWSFSSTEIDDDDILWVLWIVIPIVLLVVVVMSVLFYKRRKRMKANDLENYMVEQQIQSSATAPVKFQLKDLKRATENFDSRNELGRGGFGVVYRGLFSNKEVAVKRLNNPGDSKQEFMAEVIIIGNLHHKNLVKLVGWCHEDNEMLVVYDFMPNGSLDKMIYRTIDTRPPGLSWEQRHVIISGVAQALDYLHNGCENRVLHRDIKASNIMLDSEFNPKLGDFGLARAVIRNGKTHHSTEIAGTPGYMAPESFLIGKATVEMDVYAFGVLMLEIACETKPGIQIEENNYSNRIVEWVWLLNKRDCLKDAINVEANISIDQEQQIECVLKLGLACCHPNPYERPSMRTVLQVLKGEANPPPISRERPVFMWPAIPPLLNEIMDESLAAGQLSPITLPTSGR